MSSPVKKIHLYRGFDRNGAHTFSPFVGKLEFRLRLAGIPYTTQSGSPRTGPKGKIPYIDIAPLSGSDSPDLIGDSTLISKFFMEQGSMTDLNAGLGPRDLAFDASLRALCEDKLYFFDGREKWIDNFYAQREAVLSAVPWPMRILVGNLAYRRMAATLTGQGAGRFSDAEAVEFRHSIWMQIEGLLADSRRTAKAGKPFFALGGDAPTEADATLFGFCASHLVAVAAPESKEFVKTLPAVCDYSERIQKQWFPDYEMWE